MRYNVGMNDLFDQEPEETVAVAGPLPARMRPRTLEEIVGQEHLLAPGRLLRRVIESDRFTNLIFYGPPRIVGLSARVA